MEGKAEGNRRRSGEALERIRQRLAHAEDGWLFAQIADQLASQRRTRGLSQVELAEVCGTTQSAIARLESGGRPPRSDTLLRVANALECNLVVELRPRTTTPKGDESWAHPPAETSRRRGSREGDALLVCAGPSARRPRPR